MERLKLEKAIIEMKERVRLRTPARRRPKR
jgi:hypothetical protein